MGLGLATVAARKGQAEALKAAVASVYGVQLPGSSRVLEGATISFIGYGPGQWFAVSESLADEALARDLKDNLKALASISDQSGGRTVLALAAGVPATSSRRAFPSTSTRAPFRAARRDQCRRIWACSFGKRATLEL